MDTLITKNNLLELLKIDSLKAEKHAKKLEAKKQKIAETKKGKNHSL